MTQLISRTSLYVAAGRAMGAREPDAAARNPDHLAERLLGDPAKLDVDLPSLHTLRLPYDEAMKDLNTVNNVRLMTVRTRFIDEALLRAIEQGIRQVVILGAGFDTRAYRFSEQLAGVRVFEVDGAATQALKKQRVRDVIGAPPQNLTYVTVDFRHDDLAATLARHGHDATQPSFFILEGVTYYLREEAVRATLRFIVTQPAGTRVVFDYVYSGLIDQIAAIDMTKVPGPAKPFVQRFLDLTRDEPWVFGIPTGAEREYLDELGFELGEALVIGGEESVKRYLTRSDGTSIGAQTLADATAQYMKALAEMPDRPQMTPEQMREQQRVSGMRLVEAIVRK